MDEYLFITLAKLKSDRLQLERDRRSAEADSGQLRLELAEPVEPPRAPAPVRTSPVRSWKVARWFSQQPLWRGQS